MLFGAHCSGGIKGALDRAAEIGADAVQLFAQSPRRWHFPEHAAEDLARFRERRDELGIRSVLVHALYLCNLATPDAVIFDKSVATMRSTMDAACAIGADGVVFHVGSHLGAGLEAGLALVVPALRELLELTDDRLWLLLENSAGAGGTIGRSVDELGRILEQLDGHPRLGICLDSCHWWVSGIDVTDPEVLHAALVELGARIGLDRLRCLHINDAQVGLGSNRDRHAALGEGTIGDGMAMFLAHPAFQEIPAILETPGADGSYTGELALLAALHSRGVAPSGA